MATLRFVTRALVALVLVLCPERSWSATGPILIPKEGDGYQITRKADPPRVAPDGYEGRTESETLTAVGNTPATMGKKVVARFTLGNEIKICPKADGTSEGKGVFSISVDSTDTQPTGTSRLHLEMKADGTYKGDVGDDAGIKNPVKADIDFTYTVSGSIRDPSSAVLTPAGSNIAQHITIDFTVGRGMAAPSFGAFAGGDPTQGRYSEAFASGTALVYWAGVYYSVAQERWRERDRCVKAVFSPPSYTVRLVPGGESTVNAEIKTKTGETTKARFFNARAFSSRNSVAVNDGSVTPAEGASDVGAPMKFTFIAPTQKVDRTGFLVDATSRAGVAEGNWFAGLGTDWSGQLSLTIENSGDQGENELQSWSSTSVTRITVDVKDGKGTATGYTEVHDMKRQRQKALRGGSVTIINAGSQSLDGSLEDSAPATVQVIYPTNESYSVRVEYVFKKEGNARAQMCGRTDCRDYDQRLIMGAVLSAAEGKRDDPNHVSGSKSTVQTGTGYQGKGKVTTTLTWNLAREGTGK